MPRRPEKDRKRRRVKEEDPAKRAAREKREKVLNKWAPLLHLLGAFVLEFVIEAMSRHSVAAAAVFAADHTKVYVYDSLLIFTTSLIVFLFRRRSYLRILIASVWFALGLANGIVLANRVTPLTGPDFEMISEGLGVVAKTVSRIVVMAAFIAVLALIAWAIVCFIRAKKYTGKMHRAVTIPLVAAGYAAFAFLTWFCIEDRVLSTYFPNIAFAYQDYGFPYCFSVTLLDTGIDQPNNYSEALVDSILDEEGAEETDTDAEKPNVIIVQLESFFDPTQVRWLRFNEDPIPNWHALSEEYSSGRYTVPTVGAGTVNTEFETLTGMSLRFFGPGEYPYKSVLKEETCESAAYVLSSLGYTSHAIHDNTASFYNRVGIYPHLGFNSFTSSEYMENQDDVNADGWMRDENLIQPVMDALDATENQDFVFTVSVQPHGTYPTEPVLTDPAITVTGASSDEKNCAWEYYVNQLHEEDQFVADLLAAVEKRDEPTVVFFYGDHLPTMGLADEDLKSGTIYQTRYLMWDNIGLQRKATTIAAYQAVAEITDRLGIHDGTMFRYHQTMKTKEDYIYDMQVLQYDILYGSRYVYGKTNPFSPTVMTMGVLPVTVSSVVKMPTENVTYIYGTHFTPSSELEINNKTVDTVYLSPNALMVSGTDIKNGDWINVAQVSHYTLDTVLSHSNTLVYGYGALKDAS